MPFPGLNIDNLPFFAVIAAVAEGQTLLHDWVYENRAIYLTELNKLGAQVKLLDPHRVLIEGPTHFSGAEIVCPPALRPAVVLLIAMLASKGRSVLRSTYVIHRGYEDLAERLNELGANIETFRDISSSPSVAIGRRRSSQLNERLRPRRRETLPGRDGGAVMSAVIRGRGAVCWPALRCQSFSASTSMPRSARARNTPCPSGHELTVASPWVR